MTPDPHASAEHPFNSPSYRANDDEKTWALIAHVSALVAGFLGPPIVLAVKGNNSKWVQAHAIESLNFNITLFIVCMVCAVLAFLLIGLCLIIPVVMVSVVLSIVAGVKAFQGSAYRYPVTLRLIKD